MPPPPAPAAIEPVRFQNPTFPVLAVEALTIGELRRRVPRQHLRLSSRPQFHQLILLTAGRTPHFVDFVRYLPGPGCVLHVRPGQVQQLVLQPGAEGIVILFVPEFVPAEPAPGAPLHLAHSLLEAAAPETLLVLRGAARERVQAAFAAVLEEYQGSDGAPLSAAVLRHLLSALLLMLARAGVPRGEVSSAGPAARVYSRFVREVENGFATTRSVRAYAGKLGYSEKTLLRACQAVAGLTPKEIVERRVALEAKRLLVHTGQPVGAIALETGFSETTNFVKFFRRREGVAPSEFRRRQRAA